MMCDRWERDVNAIEELQDRKGREGKLSIFEPQAVFRSIELSLSSIFEYVQLDLIIILIYDTFLLLIFDQIFVQLQHISISWQYLIK